MRFHKQKCEAMQDISNPVYLPSRTVKPFLVEEATEQNVRNNSILAARILTNL